MNEIQTNWSKKELQAYILIFCANADFVEVKEEDEFIKSRIGEDIFNQIHKEFIKDNDYRSIQKIQYTLEKYDYSEEEMSQLYNEIKQLFLADGEFGKLEQNLLIGLKHLWN